MDLNQKTLKEGRSFEDTTVSDSFAGMKTCPVCGSVLAHPGGVGNCPQVKEIEFHPDGSIKRVVKR